MDVNIARTGSLILAAALSGCAVTSHPDYQPVFQKVAIPAQKLKEIEQSFGRAGLKGATVTTDPLGRVQLAGSYDDERQVEQAFSIARAAVGDAAVSSVRPESIGVKNWEISANKAFALFIQDLARRYGLSVNLEQQGPEKQIVVADRMQDGSSQFASGSSEPTGQAAEFYRKMAEELAKSPSEKAGSKRILIVGHTDDVGDSASNAALAERRAKAVGRIFEAAHISPSRLFYQGAGEVFPIGDNRTEDGRAKNRRVEVVDLSNEGKFSEYLAGRRPNLANYRPANPAKVATAPAPTTNPDKARASPEARKPTAPPPSRPDGPTGQRRDAGSVVASASSNEIDFGGQPAAGRMRSVDIGKMTRGTFGFISSAFAADAPLGSCAEDRPRISGDVKSMDGKAHRRTLDYMPGTARSSWGAKLNGHFVGFMHVAVLRPGSEPAENPDVLIYRDWMDGSRAAPDFSNTANVNSYPGDKALLYRAFPIGGPVRCVDLVISKDAPNSAPSSNLYYDRGGTLFQVNYSANIIRN